MKRKIILAVITLMIIVGIILFSTKSDKQTFISYIIRDDIWEVLEENHISKYIEKQKETPYTNKGQISLTTNGLEELTLGLIQDFKFSFEGKNNKKENKLEQKITDDLISNSTIKFRQDDQKIGIKTELLGDKFVTIKNENLKQLAEKFGFDSSIIPNKIELGNAATIEKQSNMLKSKYLKIINKHISKEEFSKEKIDSETVMKLVLTEEKIVELSKNILKELRNDEIVLENILEEAIRKKVQDEIDAIITDLNSLDVNPNNKYIIKLYIKLNDIKKYEIIFVEGEKEISKTTIENSDSQITIKTYQDNNLLLEVNLEKQKEEKDIIYNISFKVYIEGQKTELAIKAQYKNLLELENVEEIVEAKISYEDQNQYGNLENTANEMEAKINYSNKKTFESNIEIEGLNEENAIILNTATNKEMRSIIKAIYKSLGLF